MTGEPASRTGGGWPEATADVDEVLDVLFRGNYRSLLRLAMLLLGTREEAEEVVQDAFVSLHRHWNGLRETGSAGAYLRAAVIGGCRSKRRGFARAAAFVPRLVMVQDEVSLEEQAINAEAAAEVAAAVRALPTRQREVVVARYYLGLTEAQTAQLLHVGVGSVKRHAHRALTALGRGMAVTS